MPRTRPAAALPKCYRFNQVCGIDTMEVRNPLDRENPIRISHVICHGTRYHQGARRQDMTATETLSTLRQFWLKHYDAMEVLILDQGTEFGADFQQMSQSREILPVVTDLETPWQNSVVERHGALFKMAFEKACSLEVPTTEAEVNELIDFTFAELNRRVGRAGFSPGQRVFGRQLRLPSSLLEDDFINPFMIAQDATHEMPRSEAMLTAAAHGYVVAADRRAMSTASQSRQRKPQRVLVAGEPVFIHRRKDGAQGWCGPGECALSEEPKPGRNETVWVHMLNCLHKCNCTQVRHATNEEAEGIETVASPLPSLTEAVREGRARQFADITDEEDPEDDEPMVVEGDVMDVRLGRPDPQPELELNAPANSHAPSHSDTSETHAEPEAEVSTSAGTDMEIGVNDRRVRFREERPETSSGRILGSRVDGGTAWENTETS